MKAIFIDIDNTILDFSAYVENAIKDGMECFGICKFEPYMIDVFHTENDKLWKRIEQGTLTLEELKKIRFNNVFSALGLSFDGEKFETYFRQQLNESAIPVDGAKEMLERLSEKYILCSASNGPYVQQCHRLDLAEFSQYFSYNFISEKIGFAKPSSDYFKKCFEILNEGREDIISPCEAVMLGDSVSADINGGSAFGMKTILFDRFGKGDEKSVSDVVVSSLCDVVSAVEEFSV